MRAKAKSDDLSPRSSADKLFPISTLGAMIDLVGRKSDSKLALATALWAARGKGSKIWRQPVESLSVPGPSLV